MHVILHTKCIFMTFCISALFILFCIELNTDHITNKKVELKYMRKKNDMHTNIFSIPKSVIETKCKLSFVVWMVTTSANNPLYRTSLRTAYPNEILIGLNITRVFLLGIPKEESTWKNILKESQIYNDLLVGDFLDDYRNLTLKHLMGLKWASKNCKATFLIKSDDDIVLDVFEVSHLLQKDIVSKSAISGYVLREMKPIRISSSKWFVTTEEFPDDNYPAFLSGWLYITTLEIAQMLVSKSTKYENFFWIDDVFITGILRKECGVKLKELNNFYTTDYRYLECCIRARQRRLKCEFIAGPDGGNKQLHINFREFSEYCQQNCFVRRNEQSVLKTCVATYNEKINIVNSKAEVHYI